MGNSWQQAESDDLVINCGKKKFALTKPGNTTVYANASAAFGTWYTVTFDLPRGSTSVVCNIVARSLSTSNTFIVYRPYGTSWDINNGNTILDLYGFGTRLGITVELPVDESGRVDIALYGSGSGNLSVFQNTGYTL